MGYLNTCKNLKKGYREWMNVTMGTTSSKRKYIRYVATNGWADDHFLAWWADIAAEKAELDLETTIIDKKS